MRTDRRRILHGRTLLHWMMGPLLVALVWGCGRTAKSTGSWQEWRRVPNAYATRFQVWQHDDARLVLVFGHGGERDTVGAYVIGTSPESAPTGCRSLGSGPAHVALTSTTHVPYVVALGEVGRVVACAHKDQVRNERFRAVADGMREFATGDGIDREALVAAHPDALFGYPFGASGGTVDRLGIPTVEVSEYLEEHPLGRAEWLRFFGALLGKERVADSLFARIKERYETQRIDSSRSIERPTVLFGSVWNGQWWVPPGNSYMARLIEDAGGRYVFADRKGDGNIAVDMETMITTGGKADYWGMIADVQHEPSVNDFTNGDERLEAFTSVKGYQLFLANTATEDLFGQALIEPDVMLSCMQQAIGVAHVSDRPRMKYFCGLCKDSPYPELYQ